jgi:hypothetical protein
LGPLLFIFAKELILEIFKLEPFLKQKRPFNHSSGKGNFGFRDKIASHVKVQEVKLAQ